MHGYYTDLALTFLNALKTDEKKDILYQGESCFYFLKEKKMGGGGWYPKC